MTSASFIDIKGVGKFFGETAAVAERMVDVLAQPRAGKIAHRPLAAFRVGKEKSLVD